MKLTVLGGGGIRSPLLVASALRRAQVIHLDEICLMDINPEKLRLLGAICRHLAGGTSDQVMVTTTTDARRALDGASYIITTIRVGEEQGRIYDERIALRHGVLGQETTGPGGFAMAMRSIPAILNYARLADEVCPGAWIFNFTNPAGMVAQALRDSGFERTVGICDGANQAQMEAAKWLGIPPGELRAEVFGLNHLSWTRRLERGGIDILPDLLADEAFVAQSSQSIFERELLDRMGMWLNEYLFYYYYAERALRSILADEMTRGEEVMQLNGGLLEQLRAIDSENNPEEALRAYSVYERRRVATYMHYAYVEDTHIRDSVEEFHSLDHAEGYAGVALNIVQALEEGEPLNTALNVPNHGSIAELQDSDVVEVSCAVENGAVRPLPIGAIPEHQELLVRAVKRYERLAVKSILARSRQDAIFALMQHPLVLSHSLAGALVDEYLVAHAPFIGDWS
jgi:6-phospho-beta-glucosidase